MSDKLIIDLKKIPEHEVDSLARPLIKIVTDFFENVENQKNYEEWHLQRYGKYPTKASYIKKGAELNVAQV